MTTDSPAGLFRILGSIFYDSLLLGAVLFFASFLFLLIPESLQHNPYIEVLKVLWYFLVSYAYFAGFWMKGNQTPGMKPWKVRLESNDGSAPAFRQVSLRFVAALLSWLTAGLGFLWILVDSERRSLHDHLSSTRLRRIN